MFKRIDHIAFVVRDRERSINFYEKNFGFKKYAEQDVPVSTIQKIIYLKLGDTVLELIHMPNSSLGEGFHFCLESDDFDGDYTRLKSAGIPVDSKPHPAGAQESKEQTWQRAVFIGPDGEKVEIRG